MITCRCPHCQAQIIDDGRLAGQVVACALCKQPFQMPIPVGVPGVAPPPAPPPLPQRPQQPEIICSFHPSVAEQYSARRRKAKRHNVRFYAVLGAIALFGFGVAAIGKYIEEQARLEYLEAGEGGTWYDRGYKLGHQSGEMTMNFGTMPNPEERFQLMYYGMRDRNEEVPGLGSQAFGSFKRGFMDGYLAGYHGR